MEDIGLHPDTKSGQSDLVECAICDYWTFYPETCSESGEDVCWHCYWEDVCEDCLEGRCGKGG